MILRKLLTKISETFPEKSKLVSPSRAHYLQSHRTYIPNIEWKCFNVVLLHTSRWRAI